MKQTWSMDVCLIHLIFCVCEAYEYLTAIFMHSSRPLCLKSSKNVDVTIVHVSSLLPFPQILRSEQRIHLSCRSCLLRIALALSLEFCLLCRGMRISKFSNTNPLRMLSFAYQIEFCIIICTSIY